MLLMTNSFILSIKEKVLKLLGYLKQNRSKLREPDFTTNVKYPNVCCCCCREVQRYQVANQMGFSWSFLEGSEVEEVSVTLIFSVNLSKTHVDLISLSRKHEGKSFYGISKQLAKLEKRRRLV